MEILGDIFENTDEYFGITEDGISNIIFFSDDRAYSDMFGRISVTPSHLPGFKKGLLYPILPKALATISMGGIVWDQDLADEFRKYEYIIIDEPYPFATPEPITDDNLIKLKPKEAIRKKISSNKEIYASVHIRQGDYEKWQNGNHYKDDVFYNDLIRSLLSRAKDKKIAAVHNGEFIIDKDLEDKIVSSQSFDECFQSHINDILTLCSAQNVIGPSSTFSKFSLTLCKRFCLPIPNLLIIDAKTEVQDVIQKLTSLDR